MPYPVAQGLTERPGPCAHFGLLCILLRKVPRVLSDLAQKAIEPLRIQKRMAIFVYWELEYEKPVFDNLFDSSRTATWHKCQCTKCVHDEIGHRTRSAGNGRLGSLRFLPGRRWKGESISFQKGDKDSCGKLLSVAVQVACLPIL